MPDFAGEAQVVLMALAIVAYTLVARRRTHILGEERQRFLMLDALLIVAAFEGLCDAVADNVAVDGTQTEMAFRVLAGVGRGFFLAGGLAVFLTMQQDRWRDRRNRTSRRGENRG